MTQKSKALRHAEADTILAKVLFAYRVEIILSSDESHWQRIFVMALNKEHARKVAKPTVNEFKKKHHFKKVRVEIEKVK